MRIQTKIPDLDGVDRVDQISENYMRKRMTTLLIYLKQVYILISQCC